ncbi:Uncharacterized protein ALO71_01111 [Pseudomonas amygdali pv. dendropanacis]|uniref:Glutathionylspermidine synthase pre-ATP-grasp-like domain-containing protein n=1 Tax=Pseudomonas amygdali pv. dendropanacis TaxID=235272 RepID=A0A0P9NZ44_PSEA0|nr:hypothetical protein [Pseudomonas amygdali]KPX12205.1 Uncharacterized protein ALO71_01111 [Pseudomonas amygdali pv. dendropanacis]KWS80235.1 hypothetical protein AL051_03325 [Pseudomonas amygdali pv. dendropanacis]
MSGIRIPSIEEFGLSDNFVKAYSDRVKHGVTDHPGFCIPPAIVSANYMQEIVDDSLFIINKIFEIPDTVFQGNYEKLGFALGMEPRHTRFIMSFLNDYWITHVKDFIRPDILFSALGHKFIEFNITAAIGGAGLCDMHMQHFLESAESNRIKLKTMGLESEPLALKWVHLLHELLISTKTAPALYPVFCSATFDFDQTLEDDFTLHEFRVVLERYGFKHITAPITDIAVSESGVHYCGQEIDILFTDFTYSQYLSRHAELDGVEKFVRAHERGDILFISPPTSMFFDNKLVLSFLTDEKYQNFYSPEDFSRLKRLVPKTRSLADCDLQEVINNRSLYVVKPSFDYGGNNVHIGASRTHEDWVAILSEIRVDASKWAVQELVQDQGGVFDPLQHADVNVCLGPIFFDCKYAGSLYRDALVKYTGSVINASIGARYSSVFLGKEDD